MNNIQHVLNEWSLTQRLGLIYFMQSRFWESIGLTVIFWMLLNGSDWHEWDFLLFGMRNEVRKSVRCC